MRRYDDLVEVRKGPVIGRDGDAHDEGPQQFLWRGRLWQVREVVAHWRETGAWWMRQATQTAASVDTLQEREVWRVTAARGRAVDAHDDPGFGVFDLIFDWAHGDWRLVRSID